MSELQDWKGCDQQHEIQMEASHEWWTLGVHIVVLTSATGSIILAGSDHTGWLQSLTSAGKTVQQAVSSLVDSWCVLSIIPFNPDDRQTARPEEKCYCTCCSPREMNWLERPSLVAAWAAVIMSWVEFIILRDMGQMKIRVKTLSFRGANFQLLRELVDMASWETALMDKGA